MKKIFIFLLMVISIVSFSGCDKKQREVIEVSEYTLMEEEACFNFFWETQVTEVTSNAYGLIPDRYPSNGLASIASVGFGLAAIPIGVENGWITKKEGEKRAELTIKSILELPTVEGFYYHFYLEKSGFPASGSEISNIDTAILVAGAIVAGEYFGGNTKEYAYELYDNVNWPWYINPETNQFYMGYDPVKKEFEGAWDFYGEQLMMYFLAAGSNTHPIDPVVYRSFTKKRGAYKGVSFIHSWFGSIFTYQFSHAFVDFRNILDPNGIDWFENSVKATQVARQYCIDNPDGYLAFNEFSWGLTACDTPSGYSGKLGNPPTGFNNDQHINDGTVALCGSVGSIPFLPEEVMQSIDYYYTFMEGRLVGKYGLYDSYNVQKKKIWVAEDVIGIDKGISLLMIENYRSNLVWEYFNKAEFMERAIKVLGFVSAE